MLVESIALYFRDSHSDKVYNVSLEENLGTYTVNFSYGRRGSSLSTGSKCSNVSLNQARSCYDKLVKEKTDKGYKSNGGASSIVTSANAGIDSGVRPQLLNEIEESEVEKYLVDTNWCAQEKFDGRNRLIIKRDKVVSGANRKGLVVPIENKLGAAIKLLLIKDVDLNGEDMGNRVEIFNLIVPDIGYGKRYGMLRELFRHYVHNTAPLYGFNIVQTAWTEPEKRALYKKLKDDNAEGIVFKNIYGLYSPGRPNSGGDELKFKFCTEATCFVTEIHNTKRSVGLAVFSDTGDLINIGNCTIYPNQNIPDVGDIVEVKYLYYFPGGSLFQPVYKGVRDDMSVSDCTVKQLKVKRDE